MTHSDDYRTKYPNSWVLTYSGKKFWPLDPKPEEVYLADIAHGLSLKCRFQGQCRRFYSVAEHSVLASRLVPSAYAREALMHDAGEFIIPDAPAPIKPLLTNFKEIEAVIEHAIWDRFKLDTSPDHPEIKLVDRRLVVTERELNMNQGPIWDTHVGVEPYRSLELRFWSPYAAEQEFLARAKELHIQ